MKISASISTSLLLVFIGTTAAIDEEGCGPQNYAWLDCVDPKPDCVDACFQWADDMVDNATIVDDSGCASINGELCRAVDCCPACFNEAEAAGECLARARGLNTTCNLECSGATLTGGIFWSCMVVIGAAQIMLG